MLDQILGRLGARDAPFQLVHVVAQQIPVHDAHGHHPLSRLFHTSGTASDAVALAGAGLRLLDLPPGERWELAG